jgi:hypothetical protein
VKYYSCVFISRLSILDYQLSNEKAPLCIGKGRLAIRRFYSGHVQVPSRPHRARLKGLSGLTLHLAVAAVKGEGADGSP